MTEPTNGHTRTINDWMLRLDEKLDRIADKLDSKTDKSAHDKLEERLEKVEDKHHNLALKVGGIAATITTLLTIAGWIIRQ